MSKTIVEFTRAISIKTEIKAEVKNKGEFFKEGNSLNYLHQTNETECSPGRTNLVTRLNEKEKRDAKLIRVS